MSENKKCDNEDCNDKSKFWGVVLFGVSSLGVFLCLITTYYDDANKELIEYMLENNKTCITYHEIKEIAN
jgi:hypothetical protein